MTIGTNYSFSGKFEFPRLLIGTLIGIAVAIGLGALYGFLSDLNPIIYLNILIIAVIAACIAGSIKIVSEFGKNRNVTVNIIIGLLFGIVAWYSGWCFYLAKYFGINFFSALFQPVSSIDFIILFSKFQSISIGRFGRSSGSLQLSGIVLQLFYLVEFAIFLIPVFIVKKPSYYNEELNRFYKEDQRFAIVTDEFLNKFNEALPGQYKFLNELTFYKKIKDLPAMGGAPAIELEFNHLDGVNDHGILTLKKGTVKIDKKNVDLQKTKVLVKDVYIDQETLAALLNS
ncbi:MAG: hypothetical protein J0G96_15270 [Flavobacteriia bacterium]|nr:hypothetical protein [Flavobacteriia bacterium]OJX37636.1 MAG: hypothetical protein BGO87_11220 [Flavobacteriia bacterium 40-80]